MRACLVWWRVKKEKISSMGARSHTRSRCSARVCCCRSLPRMGMRKQQCRWQTRQAGSMWTRVDGESGASSDEAGKVAQDFSEHHQHTDPACFGPQLHTKMKRLHCRKSLDFRVNETDKTLSSELAAKRVCDTSNEMIKKQTSTIDMVWRPEVILTERSECGGFEKKRKCTYLPRVGPHFRNHVCSL
jgi:hypothetical protein